MGKVAQVTDTALGWLFQFLGESGDVITAVG